MRNSGSRCGGADSTGVTADDDDGFANRAEGEARARLRVVHGPVHGSEARPSVRLVREWKGLTVADLLRDEIVERLPGRVQSALEHIERGDFAGAERALPGEFSSVLPGPGHGRSQRRLLAAFVTVSAVFAAAALAAWMCA